MAITSVDTLLAGFKPPEHFFKVTTSGTAVARPYVPHYLAGIPCNTTTAIMNAYTAAGSALTSFSSCIPVPAASGNTHLARFAGCSAATSGTLMLCDRLWHNGSLSNTVTTSQTINSVAWPARDMDGATAGRGVYIGLEVSATMGAGAVTSTTITYTASDGTTGRTGTLQNYAASAAVGSFFWFSLQAGDLGVRSVQSLIFNGAAPGAGSTFHLVAYRVIAALDLPFAGVPTAIDAFTGGLPRLYDNTCLFLMYIPQAASATQLYGQVICAQG